MAYTVYVCYIQMLKRFAGFRRLCLSTGAHTEVAKDGKSYTFSFNRLGFRVVTLFISPWVQQDGLEHVGQSGAMYSDPSLVAFIGKVMRRRVR
ncbi:hypothetical protein JVU11DRAFT_38 [Chiua virens]|nr:hypothetical protein JVU11DRAFT_38 [Chiua virens]